MKSKNVRTIELGQATEIVPLEFRRDPQSYYRQLAKKFKTQRRSRLSLKQKRLRVLELENTAV